MEMKKDLLDYRQKLMTM